MRYGEGQGRWLQTRASRRLSPLLLERAVGFEADDAAVAVSVGHEEGAISHDGDIRGFAKVTPIVARNHLHAQNQIRRRVAHFRETVHLMQSATIRTGAIVQNSNP